MTTKADERITRIEEAITRLEALGASTLPAVPSPSPASVNPDGSPGLVAPGELITSAWGNAVVNEFKRVKGAYVQVETGAGPFGASSNIFPGLSFNFPFVVGRVYRLSAFVPTCQQSGASGLAEIFIANLDTGVALNRGAVTAAAGETFSLYTSLIVESATTTFQVGVQMRTSAGTLVVAGSANQRSSFIVEQLSP